MMKERNEMLDMMREHLVQAQNRMKQQVDKKRRMMEYKIGDVVYLRIQPYKLKKLAKIINKKLSPRFYSPYEIVEKVGEVAYKLKLPNYSRVHPIFQVSLLKSTLKADVVVQPLPEYVIDELELQVQPEKVLAVRGENDQLLEVLLKWKNMPECENSWESVSKMMEAFPELHLEDKVNFKGGEVDTKIEIEGQIRKAQKVYERKKWKPITWGPHTHTH